MAVYSETLVPFTTNLSLLISHTLVHGISILEILLQSNCSDIFVIFGFTQPTLLLLH